MTITYTTSDARSRFSEVIRRVRDGETVIVSYRGAPVLEITPISAPATSLDKRTAGLERRGVLVRGRRPKAGFKPIGHRPGALQRFLDERCGDEAVSIE